MSTIMITIGIIGFCGSKFCLQERKNSDPQNLVIQSPADESNELNNITRAIVCVPVSSQHTLVPKDYIHMISNENILTDLEANVVM